MSSGRLTVTTCSAIIAGFAEERNQCSATPESLMSNHERQGRTITVFADAGKPLALFAVADTVKASSREAIAELAVLGVRPW